MDPLLVAILVGIPLAWLVGFAAYAYHDAPNHGMNPRKWAAISFFVPLFGFFAYLFEREERYYDPEDDPYAGGGYNVHERRQGDERIDPGGETSGDIPPENPSTDDRVDTDNSDATDDR